MATPFANALRQVLGSVEGLAVVDYKTSFEELWSAGLTEDRFKLPSRETAIDWNNSTTKVVIAGIKAPQQSWTANSRIDFSPHFGALSWLTAWRSRHKTASAQVTIVGNAAQRSEPPTSALATIFGSYESSGQNTVPGASYQPNLLRLLGWLTRCAKEQRTVSDEIGLVLSGIIWEALTAKREDHHAISNVVGAILLGQEVGKNDTSPQLQRLLALVEACGVETPRKTDKPESWLEEELRKEIEGAVLIDDLDEVWNGFIGGALGVRSNVLCTEPGRFFATIQGSEKRAGPDQSSETDPFTGLPKRLADFLKSESSFLSSADLIPASKTGEAAVSGENFVLFLDLRLGLGEQFFQQLGKFGLKLLDSGRNLPWIAGTADKESFRAELDAFASGKPTTVATAPSAPSPKETLLPRILSLLDPTLPIIIFSSTHGTDLIDPFRNYGNLITSFRKPILTGITRNWTEIVKELHADFVSAMEQAVRILRARRDLKAVRTAGTRPQLFPLSQVIEIFIDESILRDFEVQTGGGRTELRSAFGIGAVVAMADSHEKILEFCQELERLHFHWGLSTTNMASWTREIRRPWADAATNRLECRRGWQIERMPRDFTWLSKDARSADIQYATEEIVRLSRENRVKLFAASIRADPDDISVLSERALLNWDPDESDELHRELTKRLLQLLFAAHPQIAFALHSEEVSLAFDMGDRIHELIGGRDACEALFQAFGLRYTDQQLVELNEQEENELRGRHARNANCPAWIPQAKTISVGSDHAAFALREALASLDSHQQIRIKRCRSVALMDFDAYRRWHFRLEQFPAFPLQLHYLADWVARQTAYSGIWGDAQLSCLESLFDEGFSQAWTTRTRGLIGDVLTGLKGNRVHAITEISSWLDEAQHYATGERLLLDVASAWPGEMDAHDLKRLFSRV